MNAYYIQQTLLRKAIHHISTDEFYETLGETGAFIEEKPYRPSSSYSVAKGSSDHLLRIYHVIYHPSYFK